MPARLAAIPRTPLELGATTGGTAVRAGAGVVVGEIAARLVERLTAMAARERTTGAATGLGLGLTTPVKPIFPKVRGTSGACAADGAAAAARERATGTAALTLVAGAAADAGSAREATMAPEMTMTAEALLAGLAEREIASEKQEAGLNGLGARWRPVFWLDTVGTPLHTPTRSAVGFGWEIASGLHVGGSTEVVHHR